MLVGVWEPNQEQRMVCCERDLGVLVHILRLDN